MQLNTMLAVPSTTSRSGRLHPWVIADCKSQTLDPGLTRPRIAASSSSAGRAPSLSLAAVHRASFRGVRRPRQSPSSCYGPARTATRYGIDALLPLIRMEHLHFRSPLRLRDGPLSDHADRLFDSRSPKCLTSCLSSAAGVEEAPSQSSSTAPRFSQNHNYFNFGRDAEQARGQLNVILPRLGSGPRGLCEHLSRRPSRVNTSRQNPW